MFKRAPALYLSAIDLNIVVCWSIALRTGPSSLTVDEALARSQVEQQLRFIFGDDLQWQQDGPYEPLGSARHGAFIRRALISGWTAEPTPIQYSEQVLKVGWPFTTVRGFIRRIGPEVVYEGALPLFKPEEDFLGMKMLPTQIVWPGLLINSGLTALILGGGWLLWRRPAT